MSKPIIITLVILTVMAIVLIVLYFVGRKLQKKQTAQKEQMTAAAQQVSMLIIDKKMMKLKESGLPKQVMDQTPKRYRNAKVPIVKVKAGPQIMNLICDDGIFDELPTRGEVKAMVSGIYITEVKSIRGKKKNAEEPQKRKGLMAKLRRKQKEYQKEFIEDEKKRDAEKTAKAAKKASDNKAKKITK